MILGLLPSIIRWWYSLVYQWSISLFWMECWILTYIDYLALVGIREPSALVHLNHLRHRYLVFGEWNHFYRLANWIYIDTGFLVSAWMLCMVTFFYHILYCEYVLFRTFVSITSIHIYWIIFIKVWKNIFLSFNHAFSWES